MGNKKPPPTEIYLKTITIINIKMMLESEGRWSRKKIRPEKIRI